MRHRTKKEGDLIWKAVLVAKNSKLGTSRLLCSPVKSHIEVVSRIIGLWALGKLGYLDRIIFV
jgi:hypothetical protein